MKQISVKFPDEEALELEQEAAEQKTTLAEYCRRIIRERHEAAAAESRDMQDIKKSLDSIISGAQEDGKATAEAIDSIKKALDTLIARPLPPDPATPQQIAAAVQPLLSQDNASSAVVLGAVAATTKNISDWTQKEAERREHEADEHRQRQRRLDAERRARLEKSDRQYEREMHKSRLAIACSIIIAAILIGIIIAGSMYFFGK